MGRQSIIEIKDLSFTYPGNSTPTLEKVNFSVMEGDSCCIIGPNGGGKSTLLHLILGFLSPGEGSIKTFGGDPAENAVNIGFMAQYFNLDAHFPITVDEVVLGGRLRGMFPVRYSREDRRIARAALEELGLPELAGKPFAALSGGQRQRVLLARALACQPKLLLLDEPTANIDPGAEQDFYRTLRELRRTVTLITVSHDLGFVDGDNDRIICVNRTVSIHDAGEFDAESARAIYHHDVKLVHHDHNCFCRQCPAHEGGKEAQDGGFGQ